MKRLLALLLLSTVASVHAAPFLLAAPYPSTEPQPDTATMTVNGGSPVTCSFETVTGGKRPKCDLASITAPGTYTLVMTVSVVGGITNGTNTATNAQGSSASSVPFSYVLKTGAVAGPTLSVAP